MEKKPGLAVMIALKSAKKGKDEGNRHSDSARELLDAIKEDDEKLFGELLKAYVESCMNEDNTAQPEEEE